MTLEQNRTYSLSDLIPYIDREPIYGRCVSCSAPVEINKADQIRLKSGGVGFHCRQCGEYFAPLVCPYCNELHAVSAKTWRGLIEQQIFVCEKCNRATALRVLRFNLNIGDTIISPIASSWTETSSEREYLSKVRSMEKEIASVHAAICNRLSALDYLIGQVIDSGFDGWRFYNNPNLQDTVRHGRLSPEHFAFTSLTYLVSILELLTNEAYLFAGAVNKKRLLFFNDTTTRHKPLEKIAPTVANAFLEHAKNPEITYLYRARNRLHHRNTIPLGTETIAYMIHPGPIEPSSAEQSLLYFLPDDPDPSDDVFSYREKYGLIEKIRSTRKHAAEFGEEVYSRLASIPD